MVYLDETMVTRKTVPLTEYCLPKENMTVDMARLDEPTLALLSAISKERGQEHYKIFELSVNIPRFKEYLQELRQANEDEKICIFMDNLSTHTSKKAKAEMSRLGFKAIYNVPYQPYLNPIEFSFSKFKAKFKSLRAMKLVGVI